jgi:hypothetical protein
MDSLAYWDLCSDRNSVAMQIILSGSLAYWDLCSDRNGGMSQEIQDKSLAYWDLCSDRNWYCGINNTLQSLAYWDLCSDAMEFKDRLCSYRFLQLMVCTGSRCGKSSVDLFRISRVGYLTIESIIVRMRLVTVDNICVCQLDSPT